MSAGPSYSVTGLARALNRSGVQTIIHSVNGWRVSKERTDIDDLTINRHAISARALGRMVCHSHEMESQLKSEALEPRIIHSHGLWLMPNVYSGRILKKVGGRAKLVLSPRGMLGADAFKFSRMKKSVFWHMLQNAAVKQSCALHATAESELEDIRRFGLKNPVAVIPNGVDLPPVSEVAKHTNTPKTVLSLGRLHPKKGLEMLIQCWSQVESKYDDWQLVIAGPSENGYGAHLKSLANELGADRLAILPPVHASEKSILFAKADLFVLPSLHENFAITVAEALSHGVPVISTKGAPWKELLSERCGWWIDHDEYSLKNTLITAMNTSGTIRREMGNHGRSWMERSYAWDAIGSNMAFLYSWLLGECERPSFVYMY